MVDKDGKPLVRKAMIRCGLYINSNGKWEKTQLYQHLVDIMDRHTAEFEGHDPTY